MRCSRSGIPSDRLCTTWPRKPKWYVEAEPADISGLSRFIGKRLERPRQRSRYGYIEPRSGRSGRSYPQPMGAGATFNEVVVLRTRHFQRSAAVLAGVITVGVPRVGGLA